MCYLFYHIPGSIRHISCDNGTTAVSYRMLLLNRVAYFCRWLHFYEVLTMQGQRKLHTWFIYVSRLCLFFDFSFVYLHIVRMYIHIVYIDLSFEIRLQKGYYLHVHVISFCILFFIFSRAQSCAVHLQLAILTFVSKNLCLAQVI